MNTLQAHKILVVDDSDAGLYLKTHVLGRAGYAVFQAGTGGEALEVFERDPPALVLLDMNLPDMDGLEVCRRIKSKDPGVLVLQTAAAFTAGEERAAGLAGGADSCLIEPFEPVELLATVEALLRLHDAEQELRRKVVDRGAALGVVSRQLREESHHRAIAEETLRHVEKLEALGQLTGGVAHDFNNLLTIIGGNLEMAERALSGASPDLDQLRRAIADASRGADRAARLTQSLLAFSRRQPLAPKPFDVRSLIADMSQLLARTLGEHILVQTKFDDGLWRAYVDAHQFENAIVNLAVNARDAMPNGGTLTIQATNAIIDTDYAASHSDLAPGEYVRVAVSDTGTGMSEDVIAMAFEPFFTTKEVGKGTGLGLAQVYGFIKQSGGHVRIRSELGKGTAVKLYVPRFVGVDAPKKAGKTPRRFRARAGQSVLVVEDDADVRAFSAGTLRHMGYRVEEAGSGEAALAILEQDATIGVLFSDIGLPGGMNGKELAAEAVRRHSSLKVLLTTAYAERFVRADETGGREWRVLGKPFTVGMLAEKLHEVTGDAPATEEHAVSPAERALAAKPTAVAPTAERPKPGPEEKKGCRVLLVEDEDLIRMLAVQWLEQFGCRVEQARSIAEAMEKLRSAVMDFNAVIIDIGLPDGKGDDLAAELRVMRAGLPIVIASGYGSALARFQGDATVAYLAKPYAQDEMRAVLERLGVKLAAAPT